jgi:Phage phiEco32-like COOH.NH2 ligase-type 2
MKIMLGCDPEAFLVDINGQLKSSIGLIGGSKDYPRPLFDLGDGFAVQEDNVAIEFNIPPAGARQEFVSSIQATLNYLTGMVKDKYGFTLAEISAASFPESELNCEAAFMFGCDPDFNAWTEDINPKPQASDRFLRSCGGHVHVGYNRAEMPSTNVIKLMDKYLGVPSILMDDGQLRKSLYGKSGAYRDKPYGVEYRTLSNFWIFNSRYIEWVWDNTNRAVEAAVNGETIDDEDGHLIVQAIDNNDQALAKMLIKKFNLEVVNV